MKEKNMDRITHSLPGFAYPVSRLTVCVFTAVVALMLSSIFAPVHGQWPQYIIDGDFDVAYVRIADLNNDNLPDVVAFQQSGVIVWYDYVAPDWEQHFIDSSLDGINDLHIADIDGDDTLDVITAGFTSKDVVWFKGPTWSKHVIATNLAGPNGVYAADMDGDNEPDVVVTDFIANKVVWYEAPFWNNKHNIDTTLVRAAFVYVADINGCRFDFT
jgi:hypothetical protein